MIRRRILYGSLAAIGLFLYLWPALREPVVHWSDSEVDLAQAQRGEGIWSPAPDVRPNRHTAKPAYLLFLRTAWGLGGDRGVALAQALLLLGGGAVAAAVLRRRRGIAWAVAFFAFFLAFLRIRDTAGALLSEALAAALAVALAAVLLEPPRDAVRLALLGAAEAFLFAVRPNAGAILLALSAIAVTRTRWSGLAPLAGAFLLVAVPWSLATHSPRDPMRGLDYALSVGGRDYGWAISGDRLRSAPEAWKATLGEPPSDLRRQLVWRGFHGLMGLEFYDPRWSKTYAALDEAARTASPFLVLLAAAVLLAAPWRAPTTAKILGLALAALLVFQGLVLGALPRYALPLLPALFLFAFGAAAAIPWTPGRAGAVAGAFVLLVAATAWQRQVLDREAGILEAQGLRLRQRIPRGALAGTGPGTLHIRIGTFLLPSGVRWSVVGPSDEPLLESESADPTEPYLTIPVSESLRAASARGPVEIGLVTRGAFDAGHFLWFPVIPRPWGSSALRDGSSVLSPVTGVESGSLDWWAHAGGPP